MCEPKENWAKLYKKTKDKNIEDTCRKAYFKNYEYKVTLSH